LTRLLLHLGLLLLLLGLRPLLFRGVGLLLLLRFSLRLLFRRLSLLLFLRFDLRLPLRRLSLLLFFRLGVFLLCWPGLFYRSLLPRVSRGGDSEE